MQVRTNLHIYEESTRDFDFNSLAALNDIHRLQEFHGFKLPHECPPPIAEIQENLQPTTRMVLVQQSSGITAIGMEQ